MSASVQVISTTLISCSNPDALGSIPDPFPLGPLDSLVAPVVPVAVVFVYEAASVAGNGSIVEASRLERALSDTLNYYPHLTGRLRLNPATGTPDLVDLGSGAEILLAETSFRLDECKIDGKLRLDALPDAGNALLPPLALSEAEVCSSTVLSIQHTRFACGGVALGVKLLHTIFDAEGFFNFTRDLAQIYRSSASAQGRPALEPEQVPTIVPYFSPPLDDTIIANLRGYQPPLFSLNDGQIPPSETDVTIESSNADLPLGDQDLAAKDAGASPVVEGRCLVYSADALARLKREAASEGQWVSTFDALVAHLCQIVYRARHRYSETTKTDLARPNFLTPVNIRTRLDSAHTLASRYCPNALICAITDIPREDLLEDNRCLSGVATLIHNLNRGKDFTDEQELQRTLAWLAAQLNRSKVKQDFTYGNGSLMISQWSRMDMYEGMAFECVPSLVAPPFTPISCIDGLGYILPDGPDGRSERGALLVYLALTARLWPILAKDTAFAKHASFG